MGPLHWGNDLEGGAHLRSESAHPHRARPWSGEVDGPAVLPVGFGGGNSVPMGDKDGLDNHCFRDFNLDFVDEGFENFVDNEFNAKHCHVGNSCG